MEALNENNTTNVAVESQSATVLNELTTTFDYGSIPNAEPCDSIDFGKVFLPVIYSLLFIAGLLGNSLVLYVVARCVKLKSMTDICLLNLAISDLLFVFSLPLQAYYSADRWIFGDELCKMTMGAYYIGFFAGIFFITLMSIDRYLAIVHAVYAIKARTSFYGSIASAVVWVSALLASFPEIIYNRLNKEESTCRPMYSDNETSHHLAILHNLKLNILGLLIPSFIMVYCYFRIIYRLSQCRTVKKQTIKLVYFIVAAFFIFWTPYNIVSFFDVLRKLGVFDDCESSNKIDLLLQITEAFAYVHSCLNPYIYVFVGEKFRRHLLHNLPLSYCKVMKRRLTLTTVSTYEQSSSFAERSSGL
ncbi:C-C chemokine receptor type 4-like [Polypterus senegalus]|uniref:C-C chemokine receptor type 4-like n=1 Tax=Polypterus senegalus TaxID=55291 RepID=UPI0019622AC2|nr:C-C chemokine receptor type 4-like [Polypterus senegalus]